MSRVDRVFNWIRREPVRMNIYSIATIAVGLAVTYGLLNGSEASLWSALAGALLAVGTAEGSRAAVTPNVNVEERVDEEMGLMGWLKTVRDQADE